jgi:hypothetical protein
MTSGLAKSGGSGQTFFYDTYNGSVAFLNLRCPEVVTPITVS